MVKLRLKRAGKKRAAFYRIVAIDSRVKRDGEYIELIGTYNPINSEVKINNEIALKWLKDGAQPTDTVRNLLSKEGIMTELHNFKLANKSAKPATTKKPAAKKPAAKKPAAKTASTAAKKPATAKPAAAKSTTAAKPAAKKPAAAKTTTSTTKKEA
jgi:small subunit ribosomal protein S16